jgi:muramoyltetrapeptide carboxypeptidase
MLTQLSLAGILGGVAGVVFGHCTDCKGSSSGVYGGFTITNILQQHIGSLGVPAFQGSFFGHLDDQFTIPVGTLAEIDADAGTLRLLEPAVS